ncbi:MFS transporter [Microbacterium oleivorans]|uniref:MFS transporter n=1 Tax=Microbacterium oleivorans TaxID=273677 RepID=A0A7D5EW36_9MICO|nr:MFS transporter [Microbacterium oleivorans]QLD11144.1 MFS transporter [Microbacterium oleivorans]
MASGVALIAATYGLVRLAFGLHLPDISADLALETAAAGVVSAAGSIVYAVAAVVGFLAGERRPRALVIAATATAAGGAIGVALAPDAATFAVASAIASAGAGLASPALVSIIGRTFAGGPAGTAQAVVNAGTGPGLVAAGLITLALAPDWRLCWAIAAATTLAAGVAVLVTGRARADDRTHVDGAARRRRPLLPPRPWWRSHRAPIAAALLLGVGAAATWNYGRVILVDTGASAAQSVMTWVLLGCGGAAVIATSPVVRRLSPPRLLLVSAVTMALATVILGAGAAHPIIAGAACAAFGWAYVTATGALIGCTAAIDPAHAAAGTAMLFVIFMVGQAAGAATLGAILPLIGPVAAFAAAAAAAAVAGLIAGTRSSSLAPEAVGA